MSNVPTPPPPPPPPSQGYGQPQFGGDGFGNVRPHPAGTTVLVLGILSLVICSILGPIAWIKGNNARKEMAAQPGVQWSNRGSITAGWICGIIASIGLAITVVALIAIMAGS